jgi:hypothetical protein
MALVRKCGIGECGEGVNKTMKKDAKGPLIGCA